MNLDLSVVLGNGSTKNKKEGDKRTQREYLKLIIYIQERPLKKTINFIEMCWNKKNMGWCNDIKHPKNITNFKIEKNKRKLKKRL